VAVEDVRPNVMPKVDSSHHDFHQYRTALHLYPKPIPEISGRLNARRCRSREAAIASDSRFKLNNMRCIVLMTVVVTALMPGAGIMLAGEGPAMLKLQPRGAPLYVGAHKKNAHYADVSDFIVFV
jgi:hypothetical protein